MPDSTADQKKRLDTLECARHAIELECRHAFGAIPSDDEFKGWLRPIAEDRERLQAIFEKRNKWVLAFGKQIPDFWEAVFAQNREQLK